MLVGVGAQGLIGGITVWAELNPWIVAAHFLLSIAIITVAYEFWRSARLASADAAGRAAADSAARAAAGPIGAAAGPAAPRPTVRPALRRLAWTGLVATFALLVVGTVVTGSGPRAGDPSVPRNGFDPELVTRVHSSLSYLVLGLAVVTWLVARRTGAVAAGRAAAALTAVVLGQAGLGIVQYLTGLPEALVWLHLLGACLVWLAALRLWYATGTAGAATGGRPEAAPAAASESPDARQATPV